MKPHCVSDLSDGTLVLIHVVRHNLERLGYRVDLVNDGQAAVDAWRSGGANVKCEQAGMDGYPTKPINRPLLAECLDKFLPSESSMEGAAASSTFSPAALEK